MENVETKLTFLEEVKSLMESYDNGAMSEWALIQYLKQEIKKETK